MKDVLRYAEFKEEFLSLFVSSGFDEDDIVEYCHDYKAYYSNETIKEWVAWYFQDWTLDDHDNCLKTKIK